MDFYIQLTWIGIYEIEVTYYKRRKIKNTMVTFKEETLTSSFISRLQCLRRILGEPVTTSIYRVTSPACTQLLK